MIALKPKGVKGRSFSRIPLAIIVIFFPAFLLPQVIQPPPGITLDLEITPTVELGRILKVAGVTGVRAAGNLTGTIRIRGTVDELTFDGRMKGDGLTIDNYTSLRADLKFRALWNRKEGLIRVDRYDLTSSVGSASGTASLYPGSRTSFSSLMADLDNFDLLPASRRGQNSMALASRATGRVSIQWKGDISPATISADARLVLNASRRTPEKNILPLSGQTEFRIRAGTLSAQVTDIAALDTQVSGTVVLPSFETIEADFGGFIKDADVFAKNLALFLGKEDLIPTGLAGPATFTAKVTGAIGSPDAAVTFESSDLTVGEFNNVKLKADGRVTRSHIDFTADFSPAPDMFVTSSGRIGLTGTEPTLDVDLNASRIPLPLLLPLFGIGISSGGTAQATLHLEGTLDNLNGSGSLKAESLKIYEEPMGSLASSIVISRGEIRLPDLRLTKNPRDPASGYMDVQFSYELGRGRFAFHATGNSLQFNELVLPGGIPFRGTADFAAKGSGTKAQHTIDVHFSAADVELRKVRLGSIETDASIVNRVVVLDARLPRFGSTASIRMRLEEPYPLEFKAIAPEFDVGLLGLTGPGNRPLTGTLDLNAAGSGNLRNPSKSDLTFSARNVSMKLGDTNIGTGGPVDVQYRDGMVVMAEEAAITIEDSSLRVAGTIPIRPEAPAGKFLARGKINIATLSQLSTFLQKAEVSGNAEFDIAIAGRADDRNVSGTAAVSSGSLRHPALPSPLTGISIRAELRRDEIVLQQALASMDSGRISLTGTLPVGMLVRRIPIPLLQQQKHGPAQFDLQLTDFALASTGRLPRNMDVQISVRAQGSATSFDLNSVIADVTVEKLSLSLNRIVVRQREPSSLALRDGIITIRSLTLVGPQTELQVSGTSALVGMTPTDLQIRGTTDAGLLAFLIDDAILAGPVQVELAVKGTAAAPELSGSIEVRDGQASLRTPADIALDSLNARFDFAGRRITVERFDGILNGGTVKASGSMDLIGGSLTNFNLSANLRDVFLELPEGLESSFNANLTFVSKEDLIMVNGKIRVVESSYRKDFGGDLSELLQQSPEHDPEHDRSPSLSRIRFNVAVVTVNPIAVRNNMADLEADADLRLVGSYYAPSIVGTVNLEEGGQIFLNERTYYLRQGIITFNNQTRIEPDLNIQAETEVSEWEITMLITGTPDRLETQLTSEPALSQTEIISVLLTGSRDTDLTGRQMQLAQAQALSLLAGQAGQELAGQAREVLGITTFRLEPSFIASETHDPGARVTLGQDLTRDLSLGYSMNLVNAGDQLWIAQYDITRTLSARAIGQEDNSYRMGFTHQVQIGASRGSTGRRGRARKPEIGNITFDTSNLFPVETLRDKFDLKTGDTYEFPEVRKGIENLRKMYNEQDRLEARIRLERQRTNRTVDLNVKIDPGPAVRLSFEGPVSDDSRKQVRQAWQEGVFDLARVSESIQLIRRSLITDGYLEAEITQGTELTGDTKVVRFKVTPGTRYRDVQLVFPGASQIGSDELAGAIENAGIYLDVFLDPERVTDYLESYYRDRGYLGAVVSPPAKRLDPRAGTGTVEIPVTEGPLFLIGDLTFSGNRAYSDDELWIRIPISSGSVYSPDLVQESSDIIERIYRTNGYNEMSISYEVETDPDSALANISFVIDENRRSAIREITISGNRLIDESLVRRMLTFDTGDVLNHEQLGISRRNLYDTGIYSLADFEIEDLPEDDPGANTKPVRINVQLRELSTYRVDYGGYYDTDRGPGGIADVVRRSPFGHGAALGFRARYDNDLRLARLYYAQPLIRRLRLKTDGSIILARETRPGFRAHRVGMSLFQQKELPKEFVLDYGYRYDNVRWEGVPEDPTLFVANVPVARLSGTLWRDTRDSILDATRGEFMSNTFEFGPEWIGSEIGFYKYFGQYFRYFGLDRLLGRRPEDEKGRTTPPRFIFATAIRLGITQALENQGIISPERFFAGGGTTMRGFGQDLLGPVEEQLIDGEARLVPLGGEALFLLNNEIRFPIYRIFGGAVFLDIGNVFETVSDFSLSDLRKSAGAGLRIKIRYLLLRFDYGFKLDRRPGERGSAFFFSIGQAF